MLECHSARRPAAPGHCPPSPQWSLATRRLQRGFGAPNHDVDSPASLWRSFSTTLCQTPCLLVCIFAPNKTMPSFSATRTPISGPCCQNYAQESFPSSLSFFFWIQEKKETRESSYTPLLSLPCKTVFFLSACLFVSLESLPCNCYTGRNPFCPAAIA